VVWDESVFGHGRQTRIFMDLDEAILFYDALPDFGCMIRYLLYTQLVSEDAKEAA
jgi:hypothetical protein